MWITFCSYHHGRYVEPSQRVSMNLTLAIQGRGGGNNRMRGEGGKGENEDKRRKGEFPRMANGSLFPPVGNHGIEESRATRNETF